MDLLLEAIWHIKKKTHNTQTKWTELIVDIGNYLLVQHGKSIKSQTVLTVGGETVQRRFNKKKKHTNSTYY